MIKKIIHFKRVGSTQDTAKRYVIHHKELAITAQVQERGRGRMGRSWYSPPGGLYVSLLLYPDCRISSIPLVAALSVIRTLKDLGFYNLSILWPNDILLNKKKVCGIITEKFKDAIICGIGLNVNITKFNFSPNHATSLRIESGKTFDISLLLNQLIGRFNPLYNQLQKNGLQVKDVMHYISGIGETVAVTTAQGKIYGTVSALDDDWALILRDENGVCKKFYYGDVQCLSW